MSTTAPIRGGACSRFPYVTASVVIDCDFLYDSDVDLTQNWTSSGTGTEVITQPQTNDAQCGVVVLTTQASTPADDDNVQLQYKQEFIKLTLDSRTRMVWRAKLGSATQSEFFLGLSITDSDIVGGSNYSTDLIGFTKDDGDTNTDFVFDINATAQSTYNRASAIATMDTSYHEYAMEIIMDASTAGRGIVRVWIDGVPIVLSGAGYDWASDDFPYDEELTVTMSAAAGDANQVSLTVDKLELVHTPLTRVA